MFYELMKIVNPELREDELEKVIGRFEKNVKKNGGEIIRIDDLGIKTMAYKIQKKSRGHYFLSYLTGPGEMFSEIERTLGNDENVIRFIIIKLDESVKREDLEKAVVAAEPEAESVSVEAIVESEVTSDSDVAADAQAADSKKEEEL